jgi:hypothetical protein
MVVRARTIVCRISASEPPMPSSLRLRAEVNVAVDSELSVAEGHAVAREVNHSLLHELGYLETAVVHVDPVQESGEEYHRVDAHSHNGLPTHSH